MYRLFLANQTTRGRLIGLAVLGAVAIVLGVTIGRRSSDPLGAGTVMIATFGLSLLVPVTTLVFASSVLGDLREDGTLVYLWLRPVRRWRIVVAAVAAALTVALPIAVVPLALAAVLTGAGGGLVAGTVASCALATVAYTGVFTWLGLRVDRALVWGAAYILVWEGFVATAGKTPSLFAIRSYTRSLLTELADGPTRFAEVGTVTAIAVPLVAAVLTAALAVRRLTRQDVQ